MPAPKNKINTNPLVVDLDGTLVQTDTLLELLINHIKRNPFNILSILKWTKAGRANLKEKISSATSLETENLPYHKELISFLKSERAQGRQIILATASNKKIAAKIAAHLKLFDNFFASDDSTNLSGKNKAELLINLFGEKSFIYAGNSRHDLPVWKAASRAIIVSNSSRFIRKTRSLVKVTQVFSSNQKPIINLPALLRTNRWVKNLLVFAPALANHLIFQLNILHASILAFISFCLAASTIYIINDLLDIPDDRKHFTKKHRPLAAGTFPIQYAPLLILISFTGALITASFLPHEFYRLLVLYFVVSISYSLLLKRLILIDVLVLASLHTLRIFAGGAATGIEVSNWLTVFAAFVFISLAFTKRYAETKQAPAHVSGRGYRHEDLHIISQLGIASGYLSVLILSLYINSQNAIQLYSQPKFLWFTAPIWLFWISYIWFAAHRNELYEDPLIYASRDFISYSSAFVIMLLSLLAI